MNNFQKLRQSIDLKTLQKKIGPQGSIDRSDNDYISLCLLKLLDINIGEIIGLGADSDAAAGFDTLSNNARKRSRIMSRAGNKLTQKIAHVWLGEDSETFLRFKLAGEGSCINLFLEDESGNLVEFSKQSEGFQWLVSFYVLFFSQRNYETNNVVFLLDEPGLHLHPLKQTGFRETLSRLAENHQLLYTTHSPFLVGKDELDIARVVTMNQAGGTKVSSQVLSSDEAALYPLQHALGYTLSNSLFFSEYNFIVEGITDKFYIEGLSYLFEGTGSELDEEIIIVPARCASKAVGTAIILKSNNINVSVLFDSDGEGVSASKDIALNHMVGSKNILLVGNFIPKGKVKYPEIEDLLRDTLVKIAQSDSALGIDIADVASSKKGERIVDLFESQDPEKFSKYRISKAFKRWASKHTHTDLTEAEARNCQALLEAVNKSFGVKRAP